MFNISISAILFYKNIKKGRYLFNMITKEITSNQAINNAYTELFDLADTILNAYIDKDTEDGSYKKFYDTNTNKIRIGNTFYEITPDIEEQIKAILDPKGDNNGAYDSDDAAEIYPGLFDEEGHIKINSLGEYFAVLGVLTKIHPRFARIPLDESLVSIDTDTRKIIMPKNNNVYAVKNDHAAETIYFIVDRYFDGMDLAQASIIVQSELNKNTNISAVTKIDIDTQPGYIIFGWPISKLITAQSGNLKFAIRFYVDEANQLVYSLGTLPQTLVIQPSFFNNGIPVITDNTQPYIKNYPMSGTPNIVAPSLGNNTTTPGQVALNSSLKMDVTGTSTAGTSLEYIWKYYDGTGEADPQKLEFLDLAYSEITADNRDSVIINSPPYLYYRVENEEWSLIKSSEIPTLPEQGVTYYRIDPRETKATKGGIYKGEVISTTGIFENKTETDNYFVPVPYKLKFYKDDNNNYVPSLRYRYFANDNADTFDLLEYITENNFYSIDTEATQNLYKKMTYKENNSTKWAFTAPSGNTGITIIKSNNDASEANAPTYKCTINFKANEITTEGDDAFTFDIVPLLKDLASDMINITSQDDKYIITIDNTKDLNKILLSKNLITRKIELYVRSASDQYSLVSEAGDSGEFRQDILSDSYLNANFYQIKVTDTLNTAKVNKGTSTKISTSIEASLKDLLTSSSSDSQEDSGSGT